MVKAYCVKCRKKGIEMSGAKVVTKNGRKMTQGKCPVCGTKMTRFGG